MIPDVKVHTCHAKTQLRDKPNLNTSRRYYSDDPKFVWFKPIPKKCACKLKVTREQADLELEQGKAFPIYKPKEGEVLGKEHIDPLEIARPLNKAQTPRVDLITRADMERAYDGLGEKIIRRSNPNIQLIAPDKQNQSYRLIEQIHEMIMEERAKLIIPFQDDPWAMRDKKGELLPGRLLFPFGPDQRT